MPNKCQLSFSKNLLAGKSPLDCLLRTQIHSSIGALTCGLLVRSSVRTSRQTGLELERGNSRLDFLTDHLQDNHRLLKQTIQQSLSDLSLTKGWLG